MILRALKEIRNFLLFMFLLGALVGAMASKLDCANLEKICYANYGMFFNFFGELAGCQLRHGFQYP